MQEKPISVRLPPELRKRLGNAAEKLDLAVNDVAKHAIRAAVDEIERNQYRIPWPPHFVLGDPPDVSLTSDQRKLREAYLAIPESERDKLSVETLNTFLDKLKPVQAASNTPAKPVEVIHHRPEGSKKMSRPKKN